MDSLARPAEIAGGHEGLPSAIVIDEPALDAGVQVIERPRRGRSQADATQERIAAFSLLEPSSSLPNGRQGFGR